MSHHANFRASLIRFCQDRLFHLRDSQIFGADGQFVDFDAHVQMDSLPDADLLGLMNFAWRKEGGFYHIEVMLGVSTFRDTNNFRHNLTLDYLSDFLDPEDQVPVLDANSGEEIGWFVIQDGVELLPMAPTDTRQIQFFELRLQTSLTVGASP